MKKAIILVVIVGMLGWALYDFLSDTNETTEAVEDSDSTSDQKELDSSSDEKDKKDSTTDPTVGLNKGNIAPDFELQTLSGETVKLSDYRGQRVMVNFWATWCPPCRAEMPDLEKFHKKKMSFF